MPEAAPVQSVSELIDALGVSALARTLGHENPSTVSGWKTRGRIPVAHWSAVISAASARKLALDANDLLRFHELTDEVAA